jgi:hypothetical protein
MRSPGFQAELALYKSNAHYWSSGRVSRDAGVPDAFRAQLRVGGGGLGDTSTACVAACSVACAMACIRTCFWSPWGSACTACTDECMNSCARNCEVGGWGGGGLVIY